MKQYLLAVHMVDGEPTPSEAEMQQAYKDVDALNAELQAKGAWVFAGGLHPADTATVVKVKDGDVLTTDGPYAEGKEHIGGFVIVRAPDLNVLAGGKDLPHVYEQEPPRLCLFLPWTGEWNPQRTLVETMLPWSVLWLYYFEVWLRSGEWTGGGMHPPASATEGKSSQSMAAG